MPQEKGIPRRIELGQRHNTGQSVGSSQKPSFYDFYYIACAVTSNNMKFILRLRYVRLFVFMEYRKMLPGMVLSGLVNSVEESVL